MIYSKLSPKVEKGEIEYEKPKNKIIMSSSIIRVAKHTDIQIPTIHEEEALQSEPNQEEDEVDGLQELLVLEEPPATANRRSALDGFIHNKGFREEYKPSQQASKGFIAMFQSWMNRKITGSENVRNLEVETKSESVEKSNMLGSSFASKSKAPPISSYDRFRRAPSIKNSEVKPDP